jgi:hypothetical protein
VRLCGARDRNVVSLEAPERGDAARAVRPCGAGSQRSFS